MHTKSAHIVWLLSVCATAVNAVALSDFKPAITTDLGVNCDKVYRATIAGCQTSDFTGGSGCSQGCVQGLLQTNTDVSNMCQGVTVASDSIIGIFQAGKGIRALCNIEVVTKTVAGTAAGAAGSPVPVAAQGSVAAGNAAAGATTTPAQNNPTGATSLATGSLLPLGPQPTNTLLTVQIVQTVQTVQTIQTVETSLSTLPNGATVTSLRTSLVTRTVLTTVTSAGGMRPTSTAPANMQTQSSNPKTTGLPKCANGQKGGGSPFDPAPGHDCVESAAPFTRPAAAALAFVLLLQVFIA